MCLLMIALMALWAGCTPGSGDTGADEDTAAVPPGDQGEAPEAPEVPAAPEAPLACAGTPGDYNYCSVECPCLPGEGDCDFDAECGPDGLCLHDAGAAFGYADPKLDVCSAICPDLGNGAQNYCSEECPCEVGEGDCDNDAECLPGLACVDDVGAAYGLDPDDDVCVAPSGCVDDELEPNDLPTSATQLEYTSFSGSEEEGYLAKIAPVPVQLCTADEDWYRLPLGQLDTDHFRRFWLSVRIAGAGRCDHMVSCDPAVYEPSPENTVTVEVYDPTGTQLLASSTREVGAVRIDVNRSNPAFFTGGLLVRVSGPAVAQYAYAIGLDIFDTLDGHSCECS